MKKYLSILLALILSLSLVFSFAGCDKNTDDSSNGTSSYEYVYRDLPEPKYIEPATSFAAGTGTEEDPYQIATAEELAILSKVVGDSEADSSYRKAYYKLIADININDGTSAETWATSAPEYSWARIGQPVYSFQGVFDGNGHTVSGIYINIDSNSDTDFTGSFGLFGENDGVIKNLTIDNSYICISGFSEDFGALVGQNGKKATVSNCKVNAIIDCYDATCGGVVGNNKGLVENCEFFGSITEQREYSFTNLGGIAGQSSGKVINCTNNGTITSGKIAISYAGGIVADLSNGTVENCINNGTLSCGNGEVPENERLDTSGNQVGGIVGKIYSSTIGGEEFQNKDIAVINCTNNGEISGGMSAAGVVAYAVNDGSKYFVKISNCTNNGKVLCEGNLAGIVADARCTGAELTIENCKNTVDISDGQSAGIVAQLQPTRGKVNVKNCTNSGNITASNLYAGGIVRSIYIFGDINAVVTFENCVNTGKITTPEHAGGIIGIVNNTASLSVSDDASLKILNCTNKGEIYTHSSNSFIGGIVGGLGTKNLSTEIKGCVNSGTLSVEDIAPSDETVNSDKVMSLSRMCGGIIGRIGETLYLSTTADRGNMANIDAENAVIKISDCYSDGTFNVPAEDKYKNHKGLNIWDNQIGGIIGNCSAADGFSFSVENCEFTNAERGLGTKEIHTDVGNSASAD